MVQMAEVWGHALQERDRFAHVQGADDLAIRICDVVFALIAIVFLAPLMIVTAILVWAQDGGSPLYGHSRLGRNGKSFPCLKFRSMVVDSQQRLEALLASSSAARQEWARDHKLRHDPRVTRIGAFIRKSSIDELPQLLNVLRGDMSLVGPRPITASEAVRYGKYIEAYYAVTPGITGLWQVSGRNNTTYRRRVTLDVAYARSRNVVLYFKILFATVPAILFSRGAF
jgi:lipopolysaccharide/colanic/teichoic acid biosynthesis glycosyltransferase